MDTNTNKYLLALVVFSLHSLQIQWSLVVAMEEAHQEEALISHLLQDLFVNEKAGDESESESLPNANNLDE
ncbi:hypothetical protein CISIN_1g041023mg, partial [Citrus sinensis]